MKMKQDIKQIIKDKAQKGEVRAKDFLNLGYSRVTIYRHILALIESGSIIQIKRGVYIAKVTASDFLSTPFFKRPVVQYNYNFLKNYIPNETMFFSKSQKESLYKAVQGISLSTAFWENNKRLIELTLIDLAYASSHLEGNTYEYLDTEILMKYNTIAKDKAKDETTMILNHKNAIEYLIYNKEKIQYTIKTIREIHTLISTGLLPLHEVGIIRNKKVSIGASAYTPLSTQHELIQQCEIFLSKITLIQDPFEQSIYVLCFLAYFQLFHDCNKRTSRMICNLPLFKNNIPPISFLSIDTKEYITAILAVYELNDISLLASLYTKNYLANTERYISA